MQEPEKAEGSLRTAERKTPRTKNSRSFRSEGKIKTSGNEETRGILSSRICLARDAKEKGPGSGADWNRPGGGGGGWGVKSAVAVCANADHAAGTHASFSSLHLLTSFKDAGFYKAEVGKLFL